MFDEGSPKVSHRTLVQVAIVASVVMIVAGWNAWVVYYDDEGTRIVLGLAGGWAMVAAVAVGGLMFAWRRGSLGGTWPLWAALLLAASVLVMTVGEWTTAYRFGDDMEIGGFSYLLALAALAQTIVCTVALMRPIEEVSESHSDWGKGRLPGR